MADQPKKTAEQLDQELADAFEADTPLTTQTLHTTEET